MNIDVPKTRPQHLRSISAPPPASDAPSGPAPTSPPPRPRVRDALHELFSARPAASTPATTSRWSTSSDGGISLPPPPIAHLCETPEHLGVLHHLAARLTSVEHDIRQLMQCLNEHIAQYNGIHISLSAPQGQPTEESEGEKNEG